MNHWLIKTEPSEWSWTDQVDKGTSAWTGVKNPQAQIFMKQMKRGDRAFFYHTGSEKQIVGVVEIVKAAYIDPADKSGKLVAVDVKALQPAAQPVTLAAIKADAKLAHLPLVKQGQLSVMPIDQASWKRIATMAGLSA